MRKLILLTAVAVALGGPLALADGTPGSAAASTKLTEIRLASSDPMGRCATLEARFERANAMYKASDGREAAALHTEGETLCSSHQPAAGVKYLASALKVIHAQPKT